MHKKMDRKQKIIFFTKLILTVIYIAGLSFAIYKQVKNLDESHIVFLVLSILLFIFLRQPVPVLPRVRFLPLHSDGIQQLNALL